MIEINWNPSRKELWAFIIPLCLLATLLAGLGYFHWNWSGLPTTTLLGSALALGLLAVLRLDWVKPIYLGWMLMVFPVGWVISHLVLALVYFGVFWPIGSLLRLTGYDPLQLRSSGRDSYWSKRPPAAPASRYFRQY